MRRVAIAIGILCGALALASPALAQDAPQTGAPADWPMPIHDRPVVTFLQADRLEGLGSLRGRDDGAYLWDTQGWIGTDKHKFWAKFEGNGLTRGRLGDAEIQALYSRAISPFFDLQTGVRQEVTPDASRTQAVIGVQGLAPYWFELDSALFVSNKGEVTARLEAEYELLFTQKLILQPRIELNAAFQDVEAFDIGARLSSAGFELRLRYEIRRELGPYVGISWTRATGHSADFVRADGGEPGSAALVVGVRLWR